MKIYTSSYTVEWAHCDAAGIVFYPHFYTWFDQGTERLFKANRLSYPQLRQEFNIYGMPLLETGAAYKNACKLGDALSMQSWVDEWDRKTFIVKHRIEHVDGKLALEGFEKRVLVVADPESQKGIKATLIPQELMARFSD